MKITEHIRGAGKTLFSFEILPPLKGDSIDSIYKGIDPLMEFKPSFIDVTYHREDYREKKRPDGSFEKVITKKRPGTVAICAAVMHKYKVDTVPHIICGGFTREDTENALIDLHFLGIDNVLALRGDNAKNERIFQPEAGGNAHALDLINQIRNMNRGIYLDEELSNANITDFCIGSAAYPEKHHDAPNMKADLKFLKKKIDAGAEFIVTQMFFDNTKYFQFVQDCRNAGIEVPVIPGIKPLTARSQLHILPKLFHIDIPDLLSEAVEDARNAEDIRRIGIEWAVEQCRELMKSGAPVLHFYTMGKSDATRKICEKIF